MSTTNFDILVNFCENVYSADSPINEAWYGMNLANFATIRNGALSDEDAEKYNVVSFAEAPADIELKRKYPEGLVSISIPLNMLDKVGLQKYGASRPGRIIGYNSDKRYVLVSFPRAIYSGNVYENIYSYKYLSALTDNLFETGADHTVSSLKRVLATNTKIVFTSSQTLLQGRQLLAEGGGEEASILLEIGSDTTSRRYPALSRVEVEISPKYVNIKTEQFDLTRHDIPVSDILDRIRSVQESYNDKIADTVPVKTGLELIKKALSNYPGTSKRLSGKALEIEFINETQFSGIRDFLGIDYMREVGGNITTEELREKMPDIVTSPKAAPSTMRVYFYKDVKTAKSFLVVSIKDSKQSAVDSDILSPSSKIYRRLVKIAEDKNKISKQTSDFMAAYNSLTKPGKELFLKYLAHPNA